MNAKDVSDLTMTLTEYFVSDGESDQFYGSGIVQQSKS